MLFFSHHAGISLVVTSQNFHMSRADTTFLRNFSEYCIFLNRYSYLSIVTSQYLIFYFRGDKTTLRVLSTQIFPNRGNILTKIAEWINQHMVQSQSKYIFLDCNNRTHLPENLQIRYIPFINKKKQIRTIIIPFQNQHFS